MSTNMHLTVTNEDGSLRYKCDLFQTPSIVTDRMLDGEHGLTQSKFTIMARYFAWVDKFLKEEPGAALDHKLKVASFLVQHPHAHWYSQ